MSYRKNWDAFVLYMEEHPGAFDKHERLGIKWADLEIKRLRDIPDDGTFHHRLGIDGCFGVLDRMAICRLLKDHIAGSLPVDGTEEESPRRRAKLGKTLIQNGKVPK